MACFTINSFRALGRLFSFSPIRLRTGVSFCPGARTLGASVHQIMPSQLVEDRPREVTDLPHEDVNRISSGLRSFRNIETRSLLPMGFATS